MQTQTNDAAQDLITVERFLVEKGALCMPVAVDFVLAEGLRVIAERLYGRESIPQPVMARIEEMEGHLLAASSLAVAAATDLAGAGAPEVQSETVDGFSSLYLDFMPQRT